jgi:hypothetical protein
LHARQHLGHERLGHDPDTAAHPHRRVEHHRVAVDQDARPVAGQRDDVAAGPQLYLRVVVRRFQAGLEQVRHPGELDVVASFLGDRREAGQSRTRKQ